MQRFARFDEVIIGVLLGKAILELWNCLRGRLTAPIQHGKLPADGEIDAFDKSRLDKATPSSGLQVPQ